MATSFTYTTLKAALVDMTEETGSDYASFIDTIIPLAEDRILRDLNLELFDTVNTLAFTASNPLLTKPTGTIATRTIHFTDANGNFVLVEPRSWEQIKDYWPKAATTTATPKYYTEYSPTQWYFAGTPSGTNVVTARCVVRPAGLTSVNPTTWLASYMGDLLFYACLIVSEQFFKADPRIATWTTEYGLRLAAAEKELNYEDRSDYTPITLTSAREEV